MTTKISMTHGFLEDGISLRYNTAGTADSGTTTTTVDTERTEAEGFWVGSYIKFVSGPNSGLHRYVSGFNATTDTLTHDAFPYAVASGHEYVLTDWKRQASPTLTATLESLYKDILHINASSGSGSVYWELDISNLSTTLYKRFALRYKTSSASIKAKVEVVFTDGSQLILPETASTTVSLVTGDMTTAKTTDKLRIYATSATGDVWYDFVLIYQDDFVFPMVTDITKLEMPNIYVDIQGIGRAGSITQYLGRESMPIILTGVMDDSASDWGTPLGDTLLTLTHEACYDPWQLLQTDLGSYRVTIRNFEEEQNKTSEFPRNYVVTMKEFTRSNLAESFWYRGWKGY